MLINDNSQKDLPEGLKAFQKALFAILSQFYYFYTYNHIKPNMKVLNYPQKIDKHRHNHHFLVYYYIFAKQEEKHSIIYHFTNFFSLKSIPFETTTTKTTALK